MAILRPASEMKDSGYPFMGTIPKTWKVVSINSVKDYNHPYPIGDGDHGQISPDDYLGEGVPYIRVQNLTWEGHLNLENVVFISEEVNNANSKSILKPDDILVAKTGATIGKTAIIPATVPVANTTSSVGKLTVSPKYSSKYVYYVLSSDVCLTQMWIKAGQKTAQPGFNIIDLAAFRIPFPNVSEQQAIASYLDDRCSKLDEIITEAEKSIEEYKELKQAVIFEAVTKGLDKNVPMKDSGYDFIGEIPANWEMCKVRHIGSLQNGISFGGDAYGEGYPFVSYGDVYRNFSLPMKVKGLIQSSDSDRVRYSVQKGDIFFTRTSETKEEIGFSCVCEETIPNAVFAGFLIRVRPFNDKMNSGFAKYYFRSNHLRAYFVKEMNLVIRASLGQDLLKGAPVLLPPKEEQHKIAAYLDKNCALIDSTISEKESVISELQKYKKSLIYEVVTGKRRVV